MSTFNNSSNIDRWPSLVMGADIVGPAMNIRDFYGFYISVRYIGGTAAGTMKLQASGDPGSAPPPAGSWDDIAGATVTVAGAGVANFNIVNAMYSWVRVVFVRSGGTGTITNATFVQKGY